MSPGSRGSRSNNGLADDLLLILFSLISFSHSSPPTTQSLHLSPLLVLKKGTSTKVQSRYDLAASLTFCTFNREMCLLNFYQKMPNKAKL